MGRDNIYTMDKLKFDPFNPQFENTNGRRGFANDTYTPSEYQLSQMSAFDHIITQGRLLRLTADPYVDLDIGTGTMLGNVGFGLVGNGGAGIDGQFYGTYLNGNYDKGDAIGDSGGVEASKDFTFNTSNSNISFLKALTNNTSEYWHASLQKTGFGGGLTLLNYERYMLDGFFNMTYESLAGSAASGQAWDGRFVKNLTKDPSSREVTINIKMIAKTKNIKNNNGTPYSGELNLIFRHTPIAADSGTPEIPTGAKGWGYKDNISPIIVRKS